MKRTGRVGVVGWGGALGVLAGAALGVGRAASVDEPAARVVHLASLDGAAPGVDRGRILLGELNCTACHAVDESVADRIIPKTAPILGQVGSRLRPDFLQAFIADPQSTVPGSGCPTVVGNAADPAVQAETVEPLVHYLVSMGGPIAGDAETNRTLIEYGRVLYHQVGCVACHEPLDSPDVLLPRFAAEIIQAYGEEKGPTPIPEIEHPGVPLAGLASKTTVAALADYLRDPLAVHPAGRMPSLNLDEHESHAIAAYLMDAVGGPTPEPVQFIVDPAKATRGREVFAAVGCASCHTLGPDRTAIESQSLAPGLFMISGALDEEDACIGDRVVTGQPHYELAPEDRASLVKAVNELAALEAEGEVEPIGDAQRIAHAMAVFNCYACHERDGVGGLAAGRRPYFQSLEEADLGDEGRFPPPLTGVGAKLQSGWLHKVLAGEGEVRPYMAARMPAFGMDNVGLLVGAFERADARPDPLIEPELNTQAASDGRYLVGLGGLSCVNCHAFNGHESLGTPGLDVGYAHERLRYDWFVRYMHDPASLRPGTRMPAFWPDNTTAFPDVQDGDVGRQIDAIWMYLGQGEHMPPPEGVAGDDEYELVVTDEPMVFRTFITGLGPRAIAIGFPEQVHAAFDADQVRLAGAWRGAFLSASGAWAGRGGTAVGPEGSDYLAMPEGAAVALLETSDSPWPKATDDVGPEMRGYRLEDDQRPTFLYDLRGLRIAEQPRPAVGQSGFGFARRFHITAVPDATETRALPYLRLAAGLAIQSEGHGTYIVDESTSVRLEVPASCDAFVRRTANGQELLVRLPRASEIKQPIDLVVEYQW